MTSVLAAIALTIPIFLLYSPKVEQQRVVTISKPLVITQERKTPAYYLYQQTQATEKTVQAPTEVTTYLSNQSYVSQAEQKYTVQPMQLNHHEISNEVDAGFDISVSSDKKITQTTATSANQETSVPSNYQINKTDVINYSQQSKPTQLSPSTKWATLRGKFEMRGIGVTNQIIELKRIEEGQVRELGHIDLKAGLYTIDVESPRGVLVAEIRDRNGILLGTDQQNIVNLQTRGQYLEGPFIQLHQPEVASVNPQLPSVRDLRKASAFTTTMFSNQNVLEKPTDSVSYISKDSSTISYLTEQAGKYRKILTIRQPGDDSETPVFSEKWIQGILEYISDQQKIEFDTKQMTLMVGRIHTDGKPTAGVQVQLENHPGVSAIYLDQFMIPNLRQTETSENGYFIFLGLEKGAYTVSAFKQNKIIGHQLFIAEENAVSYQNILSKSTASSVVVRSFDAFSSEPVDIDITTPDLEEIIQTIDGSTSYRKQNALGVTEFISRSNIPQYVPIRYFQDARKEFVHIPQVQESWIRNLQSLKQINEDPNTGVFIGFVPDFDYEAYLIYEGYSKDNIVYFDHLGNVSEAPSKGGGFVLFNVPLDAHEVIVQPIDVDTIYSQVFEVKENQVSVSHFRE